MKRDASLSPPPLKRRRLQPSANPPSTPPAPSTSSAHHSDLGTASSSRRSIRLFSWNINGLQPFIPASAAPITTYFKPLRRRDPADRDRDRDRDPGPGQGPSPSSSPHTSLRAFLARHGWPEVLFLQELKISPGSRAGVAAALQATLNAPLGPDDVPSPERSYTVDAVVPRDRLNAGAFNGRLYGVGTVLRADFARRWVAAVREVGWDLEGRVSVVETRRARGEGEEGGGGGGARPLALVNVYAVNGTSAPYKNPESGQVQGTRHDHKIWFHSRLRDEAMELEAKGFDVVIAGDLNVARGLWDGYPGLRTWPVVHCRNRADFNGKFFGEEDNRRAEAYQVSRGKEKRDGERCFDGVDVFRAIHGAQRKYTYHPRTKQWGASADRVDLIIVSGSLWEQGRVKATDILDSPQERGPSDHVPLWVEIGMA